MKAENIAKKRLLLPTLALMASLSAAQAQYFTNGNLAVVRVGGGRPGCQHQRNNGALWTNTHRRFAR